MAELTQDREERLAFDASGMNLDCAPQRRDDIRALYDAYKELKRGCTCQECGEQYREDVRLSDELWNLIRPEGKPEGAGLLCGGCIGKRLTGLLEERGREVERLKDDAQRVASAVNMQLADLRDRWNAAEARLAEAQREPYRVLWKALVDAGITRADGCPDTILAEEIERGRQAEAREAKLREALVKAETLLAPPTWRGIDLPAIRQTWNDTLAVVRAALVAAQPKEEEP